MISRDIGRYEVIAGRRVLLSAREGKIRQWEEVGHARADATNTPFYVVENNAGHVFLTSDPDRMTILRVCVPMGAS